VREISCAEIKDKFVTTTYAFEKVVILLTIDLNSDHGFVKIL
jgi:hypothetical protein